MKGAVFYAPGDVRLEDVPEPTCGPDEVKLKIHNCSTCGTDVKIFYNGHQNLTPPRTIGHEIAGEVVEVGADVNATYGAQYGNEWAVGDLYDMVRRAYPYADLSRPQFEGVLEMLAGRYPSDEFAELRPRIIWDRTGGVVRGRHRARSGARDGSSLKKRGPDQCAAVIFLAIRVRDG